MPVNRGNGSPEDRSIVFCCGSQQRPILPVSWPCLVGWFCVSQELKARGEKIAKTHASARRSGR
jgi:hypothetical protein